MLGNTEFWAQMNSIERPYTLFLSVMTSWRREASIRGHEWADFADTEHQRRAVVAFRDCDMLGKLDTATIGAVQMGSTNGSEPLFDLMNRDGDDSGIEIAVRSLASGPLASGESIYREAQKANQLFGIPFPNTTDM